MNAKLSTAARLAAILVSLALMTLIVFSVGNRVRGSHSDDRKPPERTAPMKLIHKDHSHHNVKYAVPQDTAALPGIKQRTLKEYYSLRAYPGAPPAVPHSVDGNMEQTQKCNICHQKGGFVSKFNAFAPVTPHPQYENCLQCHGLSADAGLFKDTGWKRISDPPIKRSALPGSPPPVPHHMQMRENCASCHTGPAAPVEIRCGHPERINCTQCHVPQNTPALFDREVNLK